MRQSNRLNPFCKSPQAPAVPEALSQLCFSAAGASFSVHPKPQSFGPQTPSRAGRGSTQTPSRACRGSTQRGPIRLRRNNRQSTIANHKSEITQGRRAKLMSKKIQLTKEKVAIVDDGDYEWLNQWKWHSEKGRNTYYASRTSSRKNGKRTTIRMHREILQPPVGMDVDHIDLDGLNNQRSNLRIASKTQNLQNQRPHRVYAKHIVSSQFKGVYRGRDEAKWCARIQVERRRISLGLFVSEIDAAKGYDEMSRKYFGKFGRTNFDHTKTGNMITQNKKVRAQSG